MKNVLRFSVPVVFALLILACLAAFWFPVLADSQTDGLLARLSNILNIYDVYAPNCPSCEDLEAIAQIYGIYTIYEHYVPSCDQLATVLEIYGVYAGDPPASGVSYFTTVENTDFVSAGYGGMRGNGVGTVTVSGVCGTVTQAYLYWNGVSSVAGRVPTDTVLFAGFSVVGQNIGVSHDNCWPFPNSQSFRADVSALVPGDGAYSLADFFKPGGIDTNGASLLVFFDDGNAANNRDVVLIDGNDASFAAPAFNDPFDWNVTLPALQVISGAVTAQFHVSDGQFINPPPPLANIDDGPVLVNGATALPAGRNWSGNTTPFGPGGLNGSLWDIRDISLTPFLAPGVNNLQITGVYNFDCHSLVVLALILDGDIEAETPCVVCDNEVVEVDQSVEIDFNVNPPLYIGDPDLEPYFSFIKPAGSPANEWRAVFDLDRAKLRVSNNAQITVTQVPPGSNGRAAPGIEIRTRCDVEVEEGSSIGVVSLNRDTGDILIQANGNVLIHGNVFTTVGGTLGKAGNITIATACGDICVGPMAKVETFGQGGANGGGGDINLIACHEGGDIFVGGLVDASYRNPNPSEVNVVAFRGSLIVDGNTLQGLEPGTNRRITSGISVRCRVGDNPGVIHLQAYNDITVAGNRILNRLFENYGAVAVKTGTNGSKGGRITVLSENGRILAMDRAFDNANRFNDNAFIELFAHGEVALAASGRTNDVASGNDPFQMAVASAQAGLNGQGGSVQILSATAGIDIGVDACVLADHKFVNGTDGQNIFFFCTSAAIDAPSCVSPAPTLVSLCLGFVPGLYPDCSVFGIAF